MLHDSPFLNIFSEPNHIIYVNWSAAYNQYLVRRGQILLGFDIINNWDIELKEMDQGKIGKPFYYPNTFLLLLGYAKAYFHLPYRQIE